MISSHQVLRRSLTFARIPKRKLIRLGFASDTTSKGTIDFGFKKVEYNRKKEKVAEVFSNVASQYDLMNDVMSAGLHRLWKDDFVESIGLNAAAAVGEKRPRVLDVAGGTGDIAFRIIEKINQNWQSEETAVKDDSKAVTVFDINGEMMEVGKQRASQRFDPVICSMIDWVQGDAEKLPFESNSFDLYTIAFGLRNVTNKENALKEALRVLKPGGRFMCLEFSNVDVPVAKQIYDTYSFNIIPAMGQAIAGDRDSYQYLVESIRVFPQKEEFKEQISSVGFHFVGYSSYTLGVVALHSGIKPLLHGN
mmetsp:Transcript_2866/g.4087  ORF Transcript_2866/g.4087 Transcript_2866/m.4087 type:complete len:307 (+) Transcript_2866:125-1045(+)|eukprot:CAMPEP_0117746582 /NCGR_PEP_ID=MMETSP0947-20121206/8030_1 /TAXON_ID=44440 /ORGANISM="Chattonella subsalsa, Strain CCMP2191" /LENGTH=306 /DNA_ID=CAMNT_0005563929 /DNA_START=101 /DNA_END=1021 /DNA_ORIENTATION=+